MQPGPAGQPAGLFF